MPRDAFQPEILALTLGGREVAGQGFLIMDCNLSLGVKLN